MTTVSTASSSQYTTSNVDHMMIDVVGKTTSNGVDLELDDSLSSCKPMSISLSSEKAKYVTSLISENGFKPETQSLVITVDDSAKVDGSTQSGASTPSMSSTISSAAASSELNQANREQFLEMISKVMRSMLQEESLGQLYIDEHHFGEPISEYESRLANGLPSSKVSTFPPILDESGRPYVLQPSLFPSIVSPTIYFAIDNDSISKVPNELRQFLRWKSTTITSNTMKMIVNRSGFKLLSIDTKVKSKFNNWNAIWCKHLRINEFGQIGYHQRVNHYPGSFNFGRKDRLWMNLKAKADKYGYEVFGNFHPKTFLLPQEYNSLVKYWDKEDDDSPEILETASGTIKVMVSPSVKAKKSKLFICKPPASARGQGINIVSNKEELVALMASNQSATNVENATSTGTSIADDNNIHGSASFKRKPITKNQLVVQEYIANPCLLNRNSAKFDLRVYVLVTSISPLRIYIHEEGIVRFASAKYTNNPHDIKNHFIHLTNYSVNKNNHGYVSNKTTDGEEGMKWTLATLWRYFAQHYPHVNVDALWKGIQDLVIKTVVSAETQITTLSKQFLKNRKSCFELLGFDIMIDDCFKLWLLEVNITPSLRADTVLDFSVKNQLVRDILNTLGYQLSPRFRRFYNFGQFVAPDKSDRLNLMREEIDEEKHREYEELYEKEGLEGCRTIIDQLTDDDVAYLIDSEDEYYRRGHFTRIFPSPNSGRTYFPYFDKPSYHNLLLAVWEETYASSRETGIERLRQYLLKMVDLDSHRLKLKNQLSEVSKQLYDLVGDASYGDNTNGAMNANAINKHA